MKCRLCSELAAEIGASEKTYSIQSGTKNAILIVPIVVILLQMVLWLHPTTRNASKWMLQENHPVELLTFIVFLVAGVLGILLASRARKRGERKLVYGFYAVFSVALIIIAMEEVAWGQWLFGFETPEAFKSINRQGETTIHNLPGLHGRSEMLRLTFGVGGLIGVALLFYPSFRIIAAPALLLPWLLIITGHAAVDVFNDFVPIQYHFDKAVRKTQELIELFIAVSAFLYVWLNMRMLRSPGAQAAA